MIRDAYYAATLRTGGGAAVRGCLRIRAAGARSGVCAAVWRGGGAASSGGAATLAHGMRGAVRYGGVKWRGGGAIWWRKIYGGV
jgi:hypothetical protein